MASTLVYDMTLATGLGTLTLKLYTQNSTSIANGSGDTATEDAAGRYIWTVTEALSGVYDARIENAGGTKVGGGVVRLNDDTGVYPIGYNDSDLNAPLTLPGQEAPSATPSVLTAISYLYKFMRNKITNDGSTITVYADDGSTADHTSTVSESSGTVTRGEFGAGS